MNITRALLIALFLLFHVPAGALTISGSSTVMPIIQALVPQWEAAGGEPVQLSGGGSSKGVKDAMSGASDIGMASRGLKAKEEGKVQNRVIAIDALAIIVNEQNSIEALSKSQLVDLYSGRIRNWSELGGPDAPVVRVSKEVGRSTLELFEKYTGLVSPDRNEAGKPTIARAYIVGANLEALALVGGIPDAIGYVSVGTAQQMKEAGMPIRIVTLDGMQPTRSAILSGSYPIVRPLNLVYRDLTPTVEQFLDFVNGPEGRRVIESMGFLLANQ